MLEFKFAQCVMSMSMTTVNVGGRDSLAATAIPRLLGTR